MADKDRIRFLTGLLDNLDNTVQVNEKSRGQVYFGVNAGKDHVRLRFDAPIDASSVKRLPVYTEFADKATNADNATSATYATNDSEGNEIYKTYISGLQIKSGAPTVLQYKRPNASSWTDISLAFLPTAGGTLTGDVASSKNITAGSFTGPLTGDVTGNASSASKLASKIKIYTNLSNEAASTAEFDGSVDYVLGVTGTLPVGKGGTGKTSWTANRLIYSSATTTLANSSKIATNGTNLTVGAATLNTTYPLYVDGNFGLNGNLDFTKNGNLSWVNGTVQQRITITDDNTANTNVFNFQQSTDSGSNWTTLFAIQDNGNVVATKFTGDLVGTATNATNDGNGANINDTYVANVYTKKVDSYLASAVKDATTFAAGTYYTKGSNGQYTKATSFTSGTQYYIASNKVLQLWQHRGSDLTTTSDAVVTNIAPLGDDGVIPLEYIPRAAVERIISVASIAARDKLTTDDVQLGDTVRVTGSVTLASGGTASNVLYMVSSIDADGTIHYLEYTAGTAAQVAWSNVLSRPTIVARGTGNPVELSSNKIEFVFHTDLNGTAGTVKLTPSFLPLAGGTVTGATEFSNTVAIGKTLTVTGATTLKSTLGVTGASTFTGATTFKNNVTLDKSDAQFKLTGSSSQAVFGGTVTVSGTMDASGGMSITNSDEATSAHSRDTAAALVVAGGISVSKQLSAKTVRIDDGETAGGNGCTLTYDDTHSCLEFVFS